MPTGEVCPEYPPIHESELRYRLRLTGLTLRVWWTSPRTARFFRFAPVGLAAVAAAFVLLPLAVEVAL
jgi:hypothetical protein